MKIQIVDERVSDTNPIAVAKENLKVLITTSAPQTFQVWENEAVVEKVLEIMQPPQITTTKDINAQISNLQIALTTAEQQVASLTADLVKFQALKVEMEKQVQVAYDANQLAIEAKPVDILPEPPVEEIIK